MAARGKAFPALPATFTAQWGRYAIFQYFTVTKKSAKQNIKNKKRALQKKIRFALTYLAPLCNAFKV